MKLFGYKFRPMGAADFEGFSGASDGSFIAETDESVMIYDPEAETITEIVEIGDCLVERVWKHQSGEI